MPTPEWIKNINVPHPLPPEGTAEGALARALLLAMDDYERASSKEIAHQRMWELHQLGKNNNDIADILNIEGPLPTRGGQWHVQAIWKILKTMRSQKNSLQP